MKSKAVRTSCIESASGDCIETALKVHQKIIWSSLIESPYVIMLSAASKLEISRVVSFTPRTLERKPPSDLRDVSSETPTRLQSCGKAEHSTSDNPLEGEIAIENEDSAEAKSLIAGRKNQGRSLQYRAFATTHICLRPSYAYSNESRIPRHTCHNPLRCATPLPQTRTRREDQKFHGPKRIGFCLKAAIFPRPFDNFHAMTGI